MLIVTGSIRVRPEDIDRVLELSLEHVHRSRQEDGCLLHSVHRDVEDDNRLVFLEHWADVDTLRAHFVVPASIAFVRESSPRSPSIHRSWRSTRRSRSRSGDAAAGRRAVRGDLQRSTQLPHPWSAERARIVRGARRTDTDSTASRLTALRRGTGSSSGSSTTSLGKPRIVVVHGRDRARRSLGIAASRDRTTTGRRPISGGSHHQISPRRGTALTSPRLRHGTMPGRPTRRLPRSDGRRTPRA